MKYFLVLVCTYLFVLFALSSCDKRTYGSADDDYCPDDNNAFEDMKAWYYFKEGTYWIYEEQNTGQLDTVIVYSNQEIQVDTVRQFEWNSISTSGSEIHQYVNTTWARDCHERLSCKCQKVFVSQVLGGDVTGEGAPFFYPHDVGNWSTNFLEDGITTLTSKSDSMELKGYTYYSIINYTNDTDYMSFDLPAEYVFARNIGLIRKKIPALNQDWQLIESEIYQ
jgi:hypothetical protein